MRRFHHSSFGDVRALLEMKGDVTVSVCIPTLNEEETIGGIVTAIRNGLMEDTPLVDEILVIDSDSADGTRETAAAAGATVLLSREIRPAAGSHAGKGENLWKSLSAARGDIICYLDGDILNFHSGFVTGLVGPLLADDAIGYVKAYYERPLVQGDFPAVTGGGRVSEILVRPLISMFYPELADVLQPLSGEYAARRGVLESLAFPTGYGVEIAHLIDLATSGRAHLIAQTDLVRRVHRNRNEGDLGDAAFAILKVILRRLERDGRLTLHAPVPDLHRRWRIDPEGANPIDRIIPEPERPPHSEAGRFHPVPKD
jgi:glucosyl-3-phosphoglycerate synthase